MTSIVTSVHCGSSHSFTKAGVEEIDLIAGQGVRGDVHAGSTVQHRSRVAADPSQPNLRQVHLLHSELFETMAGHGYRVGPGDLGENITTRDIDLLELPIGTTLKIGSDALLAVTGLRNPCQQINRFQDGLLNTVLRRRADGSLERLAGIMAVVVFGGTVRPDDVIRVSLPPDPHRPLDRV